MLKFIQYRKFENNKEKFEYYMTFGFVFVMAVTMIVLLLVARY